jgi:DNA polymerase III subunit epsilon
VVGPLDPGALLPPGLVADASDRARMGIRISLKAGLPVVTACRDAGPVDCGGDVCADAPLRSLEFAVVDVETTGGAFERGHRITEIAVLRIRGDGAVVDEYRTLVNPERPIPSFITRLTSITWEMVSGAPRFADVAADVARSIRGAVFVAHNAAFDWRFVGGEFGRAGVPLTGARLCTVRLARKVVPEVRSRSLDSLTCFFDIAIEARHRAHGDAVATAEVFRRLLDRLESRDITRWGELEGLLGQRAPRRKRRANPHSMDEA